MTGCVRGQRCLPLHQHFTTIYHAADALLQSHMLLLSGRAPGLPACRAAWPAPQRCARCAAAAARREAAQGQWPCWRWGGSVQRCCMSLWWPGRRCVLLVSDVVASSGLAAAHDNCKLACGSLHNASWVEAPNVTRLLGCSTPLLSIYQAKHYDSTSWFSYKVCFNPCLLPAVLPAMLPAVLFPTVLGAGAHPVRGLPGRRAAAHAGLPLTHPPSADSALGPHAAVAQGAGAHPAGADAGAWSDDALLLLHGVAWWLCQGGGS